MDTCTPPNLNRISRFFHLFAKHRGGWDALEGAREVHHDVSRRWRNHGYRAIASLYYPLLSPHPALERR